MNKSELVEQIAEKADLSKAESARALNAFIDAVTDELKSGGEVQIVKFATFKVIERAARQGRNPQTGAIMQIPASKVPQVKMSKTILCN